jgi:transposase-like protein
MEKLNITKKDLTENIYNAGGNISKVVKAYGASRETIYKYIREFDLRGVVEEARIALRDKAIETVENNMDDVDTALKYLSFTKNLNQGTININGDNLKVVVQNKDAKKDLDKFLDE